MTSKLGRVLMAGLLCGCAKASDVATEQPVAEPDCSFRAATSCWTVSSRLPPKRADAADSTGRRLTAPPPMLFAKADDSTAKAFDREPR